MNVTRYRIKCKRNEEFLVKAIEEWCDQELFVVRGEEVLFGARFYNYNKNIVSLEFFNHSEYCGTTDCENSKITPPILLKYKLKSLIRKVR